MSPRLIAVFLLFALSGLCPVTARAQTAPVTGPAAPPPGRVVPPAGYDRQVLPVSHEFADLYAFDLDGDGRKDLGVVEADFSTRDPRYYLTVFRNTVQGFQALPTGRTELPGALALAGMGHFRQGPGLVLLTPGHVTVWPWQGGRFDQTQAVTADVRSLFPVPGGQLQVGVDWITDLNGDGISEILIPTFDGLTVLSEQPFGGLMDLWQLKLRPRSRILNYFRRRMVAYDLPAVRILNVDGEGWKDVVAYDDGVLYVFLLGDVLPPGPRKPDLLQDFQPPGPFDPSQPRDPPLLLVEARDLNGDGHFDLVFSKNSAADSQFNTKTRILVHYGRSGGDQAPIAFVPQPEQVFPSEGFTLPLLLDLNQDGRTDLVMVNVEIGFWNVIKALIARSVNAEAAFYLMPAASRYPERPDELETYSVKFSLGRFSHQPIASFGDLNGDGLPDLILSVDKEVLGFHWGRRDGFWHTDPDETLRDFLPINVTHIRVTDLNGDGRDDLIFAYNRNDIRQMPEINHTLTVLQSNPSAPRKEPPRPPPPPFPPPGGDR